VRGQDAFLQLARAPGILDMVEQLIGPDIVLWGCQVFCKPPSDGQEVPWHQDGRYCPIRPMATVTVWVAIDDSTSENGCMRFLPGSHQTGRRYRHRTDDRPDLALDLTIDDDLDFSAARDVVLQAGQLCCTMCSGARPNANRSETSRWGRHPLHARKLTVRPRDVRAADLAERPQGRLPQSTDLAAARLRPLGRNDFTIGRGARRPALGAMRLLSPSWCRP
jgi:hypothetical protein